MIESAFGADSHQVVSVCGQEAEVWSVPAATDGVSLRHQGLVVHAAFSRDGTRVVTCGADHQSRVWDVRSGQQVLPSLPHNGTVTCAMFSSDGRLLITGSTDRTARVWDLASGVWPSQSLSHGNYVSHASLSRDQSLAASISRDGICKVWNLKDEAEKPVVFKRGGRGDHLAFDPEGLHLATIGHDGIAQVWETRTGKPASPRLDGFGSAVPPSLYPDEKRFVVEFSRDGNLLLTFDAEGADLGLEKRPAAPYPPARKRGIAHARHPQPRQQARARVLRIWCGANLGRRGSCRTEVYLGAPAGRPLRHIQPRRQPGAHDQSRSHG